MSVVSSSHHLSPLLSLAQSYRSSNIWSPSKHTHTLKPPHVLDICAFSHMGCGSSSDAHYNQIVAVQRPGGEREDTLGDTTTTTSDPKPADIITLAPILVTNSAPSTPHSFLIPSNTQRTPSTGLAPPSMSFANLSRSPRGGATAAPSGLELPTITRNDATPNVPSFGSSPSHRVPILVDVHLLDGEGEAPSEIGLSPFKPSSGGGGSAPQPSLDETTVMPRSQRRRSSVRTTNFNLSAQPDELDIASEARTPRHGLTSPRPSSLGTTPTVFPFYDTFEKAEESEECVTEFVSLQPPSEEEREARRSHGACPGCNSKLLPKAKFCHECGKRTAATASSTASMGSMKSMTSGCEDPLMWSVMTASDKANNESIDGVVSPSTASAHPHKVYHRQVKIARGGNNVLGRGVKGCIYKAMDVANGRPLAVKEMQLDFTDAFEVDNIRRELRHLSTLRHPHVVEYLGCMVEEHRVRILMERLECGTLDDLLSQFRSGIPEDAIRTFVGQLLEAVAYCHAHGTTHRDIKPANILQSASGTIKLSDFGSAIVASNVERNHVAGTPAYMPPEILEVACRKNDPFLYGKAHDIWSIGCTVHELLTGKKPWSTLGLEPLQLVMRMKTLGAFEIDPTLSEHAHDFVTKCLQRDMHERPSAVALMRHPFVAAMHSPTLDDGN